MIKLTLEQVSENNAVAKKSLLEINKFLDEVAATKAIRKQEFSTDTVGMKILKGLGGVINSQETLKESMVVMALQDLKVRLELYFKYHYSTCGMFSSYYSPEISIRQISHGVIFTDIFTTIIQKIPHPANKVM